jgi:hypothetical protein
MLESQWSIDGALAPFHNAADVLRAVGLQSRALTVTICGLSPGQSMILNGTRIRRIEDRRTSIPRVTFGCLAKQTIKGTP